MALHKTLEIDYKTEKLGQYDRVERYEGTAEVRCVGLGYEARMEFVENGLVIFSCNRADLGEAIELTRADYL